MEKKVEVKGEEVEKVALFEDPVSLDAGDTLYRAGFGNIDSMKIVFKTDKEYWMFIAGVPGEKPGEEGVKDMVVPVSIEEVGEVTDLKKVAMFSTKEGANNFALGFVVEQRKEITKKLDELEEALNN